MKKEKIIKFCNASILYLILGIVFFVPVCFDFLKSNYNIFELNKLVIVRGLVSLMLLLYLIKISLQGRVALFKNKNIYILWSFLFLVYLLLGVLFSTHPELSFLGNYHRHQGFLSFFFYLLFFLLLILNLDSLKQVKKIIIVSIASTIPVCVYGILQYFGYDPLPWIESGNRIFSSLGQPNFLGYYLVMILPITIYSVFFIAKKYYFKILLVFVFLLQFYCVMKTGSRGAGFGLFAGGLLFLFLFLWSKGYKKMLVSIFSFFVVCSLLIGFNMQSFGQIHTGVSYLDRMISSFSIGGVGNTTSVRLSYWSSVIDEFKETRWRNRLFGSGIDSQESVFIKRYNPSWGINENMNSYPDRAHNIILDIWLQFGLVGLLIIFIFNGYIILKGLKYLMVNKKNVLETSGRYWLVAAFILVVVEYFVSNLFGFPLVTHYIYLYLFLALIYWLSTKKDDFEHFSLNKFSIQFRYIIIGIVFLFLAVVFYFLTVQDLRADQYHMRAKKAQANGDCNGMLRNSSDAILAFPVSDYYRNQFFHASINCFNVIDNEEDKKAIMESVINQIGYIDQREYGYYTWLNIAHAYSVFGKFYGGEHYRKAEEHYEALIDINSYVTVNYQDYGRMKMWAKDFDSAIEIFEKGLSVTPSLDTEGFVGGHRSIAKNQVIYFNELIATCYYQKGEYENAIEYFLKAIALNPRDLRIYKNTANSYYKLGNIDKTIEYNQMGEKLEPDNYDWSFGLAMLFREKGDRAGMEKYIKQAFSMAPNNDKIKVFIQQNNILIK